MKMTEPIDNIGETSNQHSEESLVQVEVSHGSTSNQTTMYQSIETRGNFSFCCDIIIILSLFVIVIFLLLFWYDHIPSLAKYFGNNKKSEEKDLIVILSVLLIVVLCLILLIRWIRRSKIKLCPGRLKAILSRRKLKDSYDSGIITDDVYEPTECFNPRFMSNINLLLRELPENKLVDVRRIMTSFLNYHEDNDWILSPASMASTYQTGDVKGTNLATLNSNVKVKFTVKLVLVGSPNVGKTSIFHRILYDSFTEYYMATLGADLGHTTLHIFPREPENHVMINLQLWDVSGSESFSELVHIVYKDATALLLVVDVTDPQTIASAVLWAKDISGLVYDPYIALIRNKIDLNGRSILSSAENYSELIKFDIFSLSARTGEKVVENILAVVVKSVLHEIDKLL